MTNPLRVVLGPCPCHSCGAPVAWTGGGWHDVVAGKPGLRLLLAAERHRCRKERGT